MPKEVTDTTQERVTGADGKEGDQAASTDDGTATAAGEKTDETGAEETPAGVTQEQATFISDLLVEFDLESPDALKEFISGMTELKDKLSGENVDELLDNKALMTKYQKHWAAQEAEKKKDGETPEETVKRLEGELAAKDASAAKVAAKGDDAKKAKALISSFNNTVDKTIRGMKEVPDEYRGFFGLFMGVNNPINDVDLADRASVIDITKNGAKNLLDFEQVVIKRYLEGKAKVPDVTTTQATVTEKEPVTIKNLSEARTTMASKVKALIAEGAAKKAAGK